VLAAAIVGGAIIVFGGGASEPADGHQSARTARVERGALSATINLSGILTYRARPDGSPYSAVNQASGIYTELPAAGTEMGGACWAASGAWPWPLAGAPAGAAGAARPRGRGVYRVDEDPILLLCGGVPAYRDLASGAAGEDVRQLNRNLHDLGYDAAAGVEIDPTDDDFDWATRAALSKLQRDRGLDATGTLALGDAVFQPGPMRISKLSGRLGEPARPGAEVAVTTSDRLEVQVDLDALRQDRVRKGARALVTLPDNHSVRGKGDRGGRVAQAPETQGDAGTAPGPAIISLEPPAKARRFDRAPVGVEITTAGVESALSVPVTALVGRSGGGFAVEVAREDGQHELVAVNLGLFDSAGGRVQVEGEIHEGDQVVVPAS